MGDRVTDPALLAQLNAPDPPQKVTDPALLAQLDRAPRNVWADRLQALESGILGGSAYALTALPDLGHNALNLTKAAIGTPWLLAGHVPPKALQVNEDASPVGKALTGLMDQSPVTTTQVSNPEDAPSRYLAAGAQAIPGAISGGGGSGAVVANALRGAVPSAAGQFAAEHPVSDNQAGNTSANVLAQVLTGMAMPRGRAPMLSNAGKNRAVIEGREAGFAFPPATTNPSVMTRWPEGIAGKEAVQQHLQLHNQPATNKAARIDMGLPPESGPIEQHEIVMAKKMASQGYDSVRSAGPLAMPTTFASDLQAAAKNNSAMSMAVPMLKNKALGTLINQLSNNKTLDAGTAIQINSAIRELKDEAFRAGKGTAGSDLGRVSKVLENAIEQGLQQRGEAGASLLDGYRNSRQTFARIGTVEDALHPSGNVNAQKLASMEGAAPGKMTGQLGVAARAAAQAKKAFKVPDHSAGVHHLGVMQSLAGSGAALFGGSHMLEQAGLPPDMATGGAIAAAGLAAIPAARLGARSYVLGRPGQRINNLLPTQRNPYSLGQILANYPALAAGR